MSFKGEWWRVSIELNLNVRNIVRSGVGFLIRTTINLFLNRLRRRKNYKGDRIYSFDWCEAEVFKCKNLK